MTKIIFFGTPDYVVCVPRALKGAGYNIVAVVTQPPRPVGRKKIITSSPVSEWAKENGVLVLDGKPKDIINKIRELKPDIGVLESYGEILPLHLIKAFPLGILNVHPSLLPQYRGSSPIQAAILNGEKRTGITAIKLDNRMDHGPVLAQREYKIEANDTFQDLREKLFKESAKFLLWLIPEYTIGKIVPTPQNDSQATYTWNTSETKQKAYFDSSSPPKAEKLKRMIRAFYPWPVTWTKWQGKVIKLYPDGKIQMEGKNPISLNQFKKVHQAPFLEGL